MKYESHLQVDVMIFGREYPEVHKWLDEEAGQPNAGGSHWTARHHINAITEKYGETTEALAAVVHVFTDFVYHRGEAALPNSCEQVKRILGLDNAK